MRKTVKRLTVEGVIAAVSVCAVLLFTIPIFLGVQNINTEENFPDPHFRREVEKYMGVEPGGKFGKADAASTGGEFQISDTEIRSVEGIEFLSGITKLTAYNGNHVTTVDLSKNRRLTHINWSRGALKDLNVSKNRHLKYLHCFENQLVAIDLSGTENLLYLQCNENLIRNLDLSHNTNLRELYCQNNKLTALNLSHNPRLRYLNCNGNHLGQLDISNNLKLKTLICGENLFDSINLAAHKDLSVFDDAVSIEWQQTSTSATKVQIR